MGEGSTSGERNPCACACVMSRDSWHRVCRVTDALKVICPRCQEEGKPSLLVTIDIPGDNREVHGLCWTHRLRLLAKGAEAAQKREPGKS